ncbi:MAG: competence/damage-inducible protein A [Myxococcales bacterium]|jgi:molybdenum cofactor synthesis domain-containing protein|nr:competence/damage-inducible protein A [Myxococcales bacterium]
MIRLVDRNAAILIIGNEILTGKIQDENTPFLARELFSLGIRLERVIVCPDDIDTIARDLRELRTSHDVVFTSGGVGPTHDDLTLDAVAKSFDTPIARSGEMEALIRAHFGERTTEDHLRMALMPVGARLVHGFDVAWPTVAIENVYVLPGVPEILRRKFSVIRKELDRGETFFSEAVFTLADEGEIAGILHELTRAFPALVIGSYPKMPGAADHRVKVTFDGKDEADVSAAAEAFVTKLPREKFLRRERVI